MEGLLFSASNLHPNAHGDVHGSPARDGRFVTRHTPVLRRFYIEFFHAS